MSARGEKDGKGVGGHQAFVRHQLKVAEGLQRVDYSLGMLEESGVSIHSLKIMSKGSDEPEYLVILSVDTENGAQVAFTSGTSVVEALTSLGNRLGNNSMKWRSDEFRNK